MTQEVRSGSNGTFTASVVLSLLMQVWFLTPPRPPRPGVQHP